MAEVYCCTSSAGRFERNERFIRLTLPFLERFVVLYRTTTATLKTAFLCFGVSPRGCFFFFTSDQVPRKRPSFFPALTPRYLFFRKIVRHTAQKDHPYNHMRRGCVGSLSSCNFFFTSDQVNLPSSLKMTRPRIQLAGKGTGTPLPVATPSKGTEVIVVAGEVSAGKRVRMKSLMGAVLT